MISWYGLNTRDDATWPDFDDDLERQDCLVKGGIGLYGFANGYDEEAERSILCWKSKKETLLAKTGDLWLPWDEFLLQAAKIEPRRLDIRDMAIKWSIRPDLLYMILKDGKAFGPFKKKVGAVGSKVKYFWVPGWDNCHADFWDTNMPPSWSRHGVGEMKNGDMYLEIDSYAWEINSNKAMGVKELNALFYAAEQGKLPKGFSDWHLAYRNGWTIAHAAAVHGKLPKGFDRWDLKDGKGVAVSMVLRQYAYASKPQWESPEKSRF
jgi:hypothetical protein